MELIVVTLFLIVIVVALLKGVNITINYKRPEVKVIEDTLYDEKGEANEEDYDYLEGLLKEVHTIMQEDTLDG